MDLVAWTLVILLSVGVLLGIFFSLNTRRAFLMPDDTEATPECAVGATQARTNTTFAGGDYQPFRRGSDVGTLGIWRPNPVEGVAL